MMPEAMFQEVTSGDPESLISIVPYLGGGGALPLCKASTFVSMSAAA